MKEVVAAAHEAWSEEYEEQAATFASNVEEEAVWRGASGLEGAVMEAEDARWKVAARVRKVWRSACECMIGLLVLEKRYEACIQHKTNGRKCRENGS